mgnify:CR=1 FL=1
MAEAGSPPQATGQPTKERIVKSESKKVQSITDEGQSVELVLGLMNSFAIN